ncbi:MAG TPA: hypothetical protein DIW43_18760 [Spongiibacteraceae bacterium]|nr:hypothetical protein [Spongiibacteraceae bacterium]HCS29504.1 hypothetical protein [Spongiibacteraceae bacterium]
MGVTGLEGVAIKLRKLFRHLREGTLFDVITIRLGGLPSAVRLKYYGAKDVPDAVRNLVKIARLHVARQPEKSWVLCVGGSDDFHLRLESQLRRKGVRSRSASIDDLNNLPAAEPPVLVLCGYANARATTQLARALSRHSQLSHVPFEYAANLDPELEVFRNLDEYSTTNFVSPLLLEEITPYQIYLESLESFEQKCGLRDFLDLFQLIKQIVVNEVEGDIAEFGSFRGHSGWLISRSLEVLESSKRLYMFDTFENFPDEPLGVDAFWSATHKVDFKEVKDKLSGFKNTFLVKGDFTISLESSPLDSVSLAFVDCDSFRATEYLINIIPDKYLTPNGLFVLEDYGHPALLGNRLAVHEHLAGRKDMFKFFSQFSGLYIAQKNSVGV